MAAVESSQCLRLPRHDAMYQSKGGVDYNDNDDHEDDVQALVQKQKQQHRGSQPPARNQLTRRRRCLRSTSSSYDPSQELMVLRCQQLRYRPYDDEIEEHAGDDDSTVGSTRTGYSSSTSSSFLPFIDWEDKDLFHDQSLDDSIPTPSQLQLLYNVEPCLRERTELFLMTPNAALSAAEDSSRLDTSIDQFPRRRRMHEEESDAIQHPPTPSNAKKTNTPRLSTSPASQTTATSRTTGSSRTASDRDQLFLPTCSPPRPSTSPVRTVRVKHSNPSDDLAFDDFVGTRKQNDNEPRFAVGAHKPLLKYRHSKKEEHRISVRLNHAESENSIAEEEEEGIEAVLRNNTSISSSPSFPPIRYAVRGASQDSSSPRSPTRNKNSVSPRRTPLVSNNALPPEEPHSPPSPRRVVNLNAPPQPGTEGEVEAVLVLTPTSPRWPANSPNRNVRSKSVPTASQFEPQHDPSPYNHIPVSDGHGMVKVPNKLLELPTLAKKDVRETRMDVVSLPPQAKKMDRDSMRRATSLLQAGMKQLDEGKYSTALQSFGKAATVFRLKKPVALARVLDLSGLAYSRTRQFRHALKCFDEALTIRYRELGKWHVDTVDSMKNIGHVYLHSGNARAARRCYWQVFWVRKAIFGNIHPSVAVAAHDLANAFRGERRITDAQKYYRTAMEIYEKNSLPKTNPTITNLIRDINQLKTITRQPRKTQGRTKAKPISHSSTETTATTSAATTITSSSSSSNLNLDHSTLTAPSKTQGCRQSTVLSSLQENRRIVRVKTDPKATK